MAPLAEKHSCYRRQVECMLKTPFINIRISQRLLSIEALQKARYRVVAATTRGDSCVQLL